MACGCSKRARAAARGQAIVGYRVYLDVPDAEGVGETRVIPKLEDPPFFSVPDAKAEVRKQGGGTVRTEYRTAS